MLHLHKGPTIKQVVGLPGFKRVSTLHCLYQLQLPCLIVGSLSKSITSGLATCTSPTIMTSSGERVGVGPGDSMVIGSWSVLTPAELSSVLSHILLLLLFVEPGAVGDSTVISGSALIVVVAELSSFSSSSLLLLFSCTTHSDSSFAKK